MKPASPDPVREKLESRLRYYEDLGIRAFYRDRVASGENLLSSGKMMASPKILVPPAAQEKAPPATKSSAPPQPAPLSQEKFAKVQAISHGPSLFEAAERVEGDTLER